MKDGLRKPPSGRGFWWRDQARGRQGPVSGKHADPLRLLVPGFVQEATCPVHPLTRLCAVWMARSPLTEKPGIGESRSEDGGVPGDGRLATGEFQEGARPPPHSLGVKTRRNERRGDRSQSSHGETFRFPAEQRREQLKEFFSLFPRKAVCITENADLTRALSWTATRPAGSPVITGLGRGTPGGRGARTYRPSSWPRPFQSAPNSAIRSPFRKRTPHRTCGEPGSE